MSAAAQPYGVLRELEFLDVDAILDEIRLLRVQLVPHGGQGDGPGWQQLRDRWSQLCKTLLWGGVPILTIHEGGGKKRAPWPGDDCA